MNPNYNKIITLYNCLKAKDAGGNQDIWQRTVLSPCFFKSKITEIQSGTEARKVNTYTVRIPEDGRYLPYRDWKALPEEERKLFYTLSEGDIVVCGECMDVITGKSPDTASQLISRHQPDAFRITAMTDNTSHRMGKHYKVEG